MRSFLEMNKINRTLAKATTRLIVENQNHVDKIEKDSRKIKKLEHQLMDESAILENQMERTEELRQDYRNLITFVNNFMKRSKLKCLCERQLQCNSSICKKLKETVNIESMSETDSDSE